MADLTPRASTFTASNASVCVRMADLTLAALSKAKVLDADMLARVTDPYTRMSLPLQAAFGLRREESIKIKPGWADCGTFLRLQDSWTQGGKYREVPITTALQRAVLDAAKILAGKGSLIPAEMPYRDQLNRFRAHCDKAGIHGVHGLRHEYAQRRYAELTGWPCPATGGMTSKQLDAANKLVDQAAQRQLSMEMGHFREQVTSIYLGR